MGGGEGGWEWGGWLGEGREGGGLGSSGCCCFRVTMIQVDI